MDYEYERARQQFILEVRSVTLMRGKETATASIEEMHAELTKVLDAYVGY